MKTDCQRICLTLGFVTIISMLLLDHFTHPALSEGAGITFPDFTLSASPNSIESCINGGSVAYTVQVGQIENYSDIVTLSSEGTPPGTTVSFSANPVLPNTPPTVSTMTIENITGNIAGSYGIDITGISPTSTHTVTVQLELFDTIGGAPILSTPANGAADISLSPTFSWSSVMGVSSYQIDIAEDAGFTGIVYSASNIQSPTFALPVNLDPTTTYFWRVRGSNPCANGGYASAFSFTTGGAVIYLPAILK